MHRSPSPAARDGGTQPARAANGRAVQERSSAPERPDEATPPPAAQAPTVQPPAQLFVVRVLRCPTEERLELAAEQIAVDLELPFERVLQVLQSASRRNEQQGGGSVVTRPLPPRQAMRITDAFVRGGVLAECLPAPEPAQPSQEARQALHPTLTPPPDEPLVTSRKLEPVPPQRSRVRNAAAALEDWRAGQRRSARWWQRAGIRRSVQIVLLSAALALLAFLSW